MERERKKKEREEELQRKEKLKNLKKAEKARKLLNKQGSVKKQKNMQKGTTVIIIIIAHDNYHAQV